MLPPSQEACLLQNWTPARSVKIFSVVCVCVRFACVFAQRFSPGEEVSASDRGELTDLCGFVFSCPFLVEQSFANQSG